MKALMLDGFREIKNNFKRFISLVLIVFLGVGFFAGIKATSPDMRKTVDMYFDDKNVMDLEILSTLGLTTEDIEELQNIEGVQEVEGSYSKDALIKNAESTTEGEEITQKEVAVKILTLGEKINAVDLVEGRLPETELECVVESDFLRGTNHKIGDVIEFQTEGEDYFLKNAKSKIVGTVKSPLYISRERGSTKLASGKISYYVYVSKVSIEEETSKVFTEIYLTTEKGKKELSFSQKYKDIVKEVQDKVNKIADSRKEARYQSVKTEAEDRLQEATDEFEKQKKEAEDKIREAEELIQENEKKIQDSKTEIEKAEKEMNQQEKQAKSEFSKADKQIEEAEKQLEEKEQELQQGKEQYETQKQQAEEGIEQLESGIQTIDNSLQGLYGQREQILQAGGDTTYIDGIIADVEKQKQGLQQQKQKIEQELAKAKTQLDKGEAALKTGKEEIAKQKKMLQSAKKQANTQIASAKKQITEGKQQITEGETELQKGKKELEENKIEAEKKIQEAEEDLEEAKDKIKQLERPTWYILNRSQNVGYASYEQDTDRIANIGKVFPVVFFVVAALISLTSMTRMVEEQRTQIGTLKALGYGKLQITQKYALYAILATIIGAISGMTLGFVLIPRLITNIYAMMYVTPVVVTEFNTFYAITGLGIALACTVGATIYSSAKELACTPAVLMRPKAPKMGKRVLLEKIPFIWSHLKFTQKVTVRNIFRYKKRFLMTIIGILGCTSLIVAGFGLRDSVSSMIPSQYGEVFQYQISISLKEDISRKETEEKLEELKQSPDITQMMLFHEQAADILEKENTQDIQLIIPEKKEEIENYIHLENAKQKGICELTEEGILITEKLARLLDITVGDMIVVNNADDKQTNVKVIGIVKNYLMHYIYMSPELYQERYGENIKFNTILGKMQGISKEQEEMIGKQILQDEKITNVTFTSATKNIFSDVMDNMTFVVWVLIVSAGLLAFVVLYNLANVNISERIRELATIKVLGFYDKEVYKYISRETIILTIIGIIIGLFCGYILNMFIIKTCELDMLMFDYRINPMTYVYSVVLTVFFTLIVNIATYFSLKKIDMIESLKSVE